MKNKISQFDVVTVGGATRDIMFYSGEGEIISTANLTKQKLLAFEYGAKILADQIHFTFGGGAANTATTFANLKLKTAAVVRVGDDDNGKEAIKNMKNRGVNVDLIKIDRQKQTGFSMILTVNNKEKEHVAFLHRGANDSLSASDILMSKFETKWFYVSSLPEACWEKVMAKLLKQKRPIAWNPGSRQLAGVKKIKKYLPKINLLIINKDEALEFRKLKNIKSLIKYIHNLGPKLVVITDGDKGAYVYDGKKYYFMKAKSGKKPVDTIGVGDAFAAGFTSALVYGKNIKDALTWGINNSASTVTKIGAQNGLLTKRTISR